MSENILSIINNFLKLVEKKWSTQARKTVLSLQFTEIFKVGWVERDKAKALTVNEAIFSKKGLKMGAVLN